MMLRLGPKTLVRKGRAGSFLTFNKNGVFTISVELAKKLELKNRDQVELIFDCDSKLKDLYIVKSEFGFPVRKASKYEHFHFNSRRLQEELIKLLEISHNGTVKIMSGIESTKIADEEVVPLITANILTL